MHSKQKSRSWIKVIHDDEDIIIIIIIIVII
jgi:hypothetical protein